MQLWTLMLLLFFKENNEKNVSQFQFRLNIYEVNDQFGSAFPLFSLFVRWYVNRGKVCLSSWNSLVQDISESVAGVQWVHLKAIQQCHIFTSYTIHLFFSGWREGLLQFQNNLSQSPLKLTGQMIVFEKKDMVINDWLSLRPTRQVGRQVRFDEGHSEVWRWWGRTKPLFHPLLKLSSARPPSLSSKALLPWRISLTLMVSGHLKHWTKQPALKMFSELCGKGHQSKHPATPAGWARCRCRLANLQSSFFTSAQSGKSWWGVKCVIKGEI